MGYFSGWLEPVDGIDYNWTLGMQIFGCFMCIVLAGLEFSGFAFQEENNSGYWIYCIFFFPMCALQYIIRSRWLMIRFVEDAADTTKPDSKKEK